MQPCMVGLGVLSASNNRQTNRNKKRLETEREACNKRQKRGEKKGKERQVNLLEYRTLLPKHWF